MVKFVLFWFSAFLIIIGCGSLSESPSSVSQSTSISSIKDSSRHNRYSWVTSYQPANNVVNRIPVPKGYTRTQVGKGSFADWLRHLPIKDPQAPVKLYDGSLKYNQEVHAAVIDIDAGGKEDLQQCADACMRLKAEYHFSRNESSRIHFKFTSGHVASWDKWKQGYRPIIKGNNVSWAKNSNPDSSYKNFKNYLKTVYRYAGSHSLSQELKSVSNDQIQPGDIFIKGGFPGHAVMVIDVAENQSTKEKIFLIAQSYMPAQDIHILKNFNNTDLNPWYTSQFTETLATPEWTFTGQCLKRFP